MNDKRRTLTDEERRSCGSIFAFELYPFVEDQDDQVEENTGEKQNLRQEFHKDRIMMSEISEWTVSSMEQILCHVSTMNLQMIA